MNVALWLAAWAASGVLIATGMDYAYSRSLARRYRQPVAWEFDKVIALAGAIAGPIALLAATAAWLLIAD